MIILNDTKFERILIEAQIQSLKGVISLIGSILETLEIKLAELIEKEEKDAIGSTTK